MTRYIPRIDNKRLTVAIRRTRARWQKAYRPAAAYLVVMIGLGAALGARTGSVIVAGVALLAVMVPRIRTAVVAEVSRHVGLRRIDMALLDAMEIRAPYVGSVKDTEIGEEVVVQVVRGGVLAEIERHHSAIAAALRARSVRVTQCPEDASLAQLTVVRTEPFAEIAEGYPVFSGESFSVHERIPLGVDEDGAVVGVPLIGHHFLIGGEPGSGKSVSLSVLLCAAALDPHVELWLMDGKLIELAGFRPVAKRCVGPDVGEATAVLEELCAEMAARYERLLERGARKVERGDGEQVILLCVDELAFYVAGSDKKASEAFSGRLRDLVARGRAAGIIVVAATQKPSADLVPSALRDNFSFRLAHRCATRDASDTILGSGWASEGASAASIDPALRGVGYLLADGGVPRRIRSYHLDDAEIYQIVRRAVTKRQECEP